MLVFNKSIARVLVLAGCSVLAACPHGEQLCLSVIDPQADHLTVAIQPGGGCAANPKVTSVEIYKRGAYEQRWAVGASAPSVLQQVTYGTVPPGFYLSIPATLPIRSGDSVAVSIRGPGLVGGIELTAK